MSAFRAQNQTQKLVWRGQKLPHTILKMKNKEGSRLIFVLQYVVGLWSVLDMPRKSRHFILQLYGNRCFFVNIFFYMNKKYKKNGNKDSF